MLPDQDSYPLPSPEEMANISGSYLELIKNHANEISWLLEQHANLRSEYITFFKKDLKEIESALQEIINEDKEKNSGILEKIVTDFRKDLERSYELLNFTFFWKLARIVEEGGDGYDQDNPS